MTAPRFYVYHLIDPRDGSVFYVGKGQRSRGHDHAKKHAAGRDESKHPKDRRIREILAAKQEVRVDIVERFAHEADALEFERAEIARIGIDRLTNIMSGYHLEAAIEAKQRVEADDPKPRPAHRPSSYTDERAEEICDLLANGLSLVAICRREGMPDYRTIMRWLAAHEEFRLKYALAREIQAEYYAEEIIDIADEELQDPQRSRLRVDSRKWYASKLLPKKYGDKVTQEIGGIDGKPIETSDRTAADAARRIAFVLARAAAQKKKST